MSDQDGSVAAEALIQGSQRINNEIPSRPSAEQVSLSVAPGWSCSSSEVGEGHLQPIISPALSSYPSPPPSLLPHGGGMGFGGRNTVAAIASSSQSDQLISLSYTFFTHVQNYSALCSSRTLTVLCFDLVMLLHFSRASPAKGVATV